MKKLKRCLAALLAAAMLCTMVLPVFAGRMPDFDRTGTVRVRIEANVVRDGETVREPVPGGTISITRVATIYSHDGNSYYKLEDFFAAAGVSDSELNSHLINDSAALAQLFSDHMAKFFQDKSPDEYATLDENGSAVFDELPLGLYLVRQGRSAVGYSPFRPFLVSVPYFVAEDNVYIYDIDTAPKVGPTDPTPTPTPHIPFIPIIPIIPIWPFFPTPKPPVPTETPTIPVPTPTPEIPVIEIPEITPPPIVVETPEPTDSGWIDPLGAGVRKEKDDKSEQDVQGANNRRPKKTGQLWWPVPLMAAGGVLLFAAGWKRRSDDEDEEES